MTQARRMAKYMAHHGKPAALIPLYWPKFNNIGLNKFKAKNSLAYNIAKAIS